MGMAEGATHRADSTEACAKICSETEGCLAYEWKENARTCRLGISRDPVTTNYGTIVFCAQVFECPTEQPALYGNDACQPGATCEYEPVYCCGEFQGYSVQAECKSGGYGWWFNSPGFYCDPCDAGSTTSTDIDWSVPRIAAAKAKRSRNAVKTIRARDFGTADLFPTLNGAGAVCPTSRSDLAFDGSCTAGMKCEYDPVWCNGELVGMEYVAQCSEDGTSWHMARDQYLRAMRDVCENGLRRFSRVKKSVDERELGDFQGRGRRRGFIPRIPMAGRRLVESEEAENDSAETQKDDSGDPR